MRSSGVSSFYSAFQQNIPTLNKRKLNTKYKKKVVWIVLPIKITSLFNSIKHKLANDQDNNGKIPEELKPILAVNVILFFKKGKLRIVNPHPKKKEGKMRNSRCYEHHKGTPTNFRTHLH